MEPQKSKIAKTILSKQNNCGRKELKVLPILHGSRLPTNARPISKCLCFSTFIYESWPQTEVGFQF